MDDAEQLMPRYLRFVRGVVDSSDLPLNISREILQHNKIIDTIRGTAVKKVLGLFEELVEKGEYDKVWKTLGQRLLLPIDLVCTQQTMSGQPLRTYPADNVEAGWIAVDIGPQSVALFTQRLKGAGTIVWNGPMGIFEIKDFAAGTRAIGEFIGGSGAYTLVGGGDTAAAVDSLGLTGRYSHISTGGGATFEYLEGKELPGIAVLREA